MYVCTCMMIVCGSYNTVLSAPHEVYNGTTFYDAHVLNALSCIMMYQYVYNMHVYAL